MRTPVIDGQSIDQFIPADLRHMFYQHPMPKYKYAIHNGYAPHSFSVDGLVLYLPLWALKGSSFKSVDAYKHTATVTGAGWTPQGRAFNGSTDKITIPHNAVFNTPKGFSVALWLKVNNLPAENYAGFIRKGATGAGGAWNFHLHSARHFYFVIRNAADDADASSYYTPATPGTGVWYFVVCYHDLTNAGMYVNGSTAGVTTAAAAWDSNTNSNDIELGIDTYYLDGWEGEAWLYNRALTLAEALHMYNCTVWRYQ